MDSISTDYNLGHYANNNTHKDRSNALEGQTLREKVGKWASEFFNCSSAVRSCPGVLHNPH
jgi:hypothetical protein